MLVSLAPTEAVVALIVLKIAVLEETKDSEIEVAICADELKIPPGRFKVIMVSGEPLSSVSVLIIEAISPANTIDSLLAALTTSLDASLPVILSVDVVIPAMFDWLTTLTLLSASNTNT